MPRQPAATSTLSSSKVSTLPTALWALLPKTNLARPAVTCVESGVELSHREVQDISLSFAGRLTRDLGYAAGDKLGLVLGGNCVESVIAQLGAAAAGVTVVTAAKPEDNVLEGCRHHGIENLVYASSSSVYGGNRNLPFHEQQPVNHPVSLYAASKKANELMAHTYSHLYGVPATGLRFFTVYGPWGRPDMAPMLFARAILAGEPIKVFNHGKMQRDFTYIDDIVEGVLRCCDKPATPNTEFDSLNPDPATAAAPYRVFNIGNSQPIELLRFIEVMEGALGREAIKDFQPMQPGDVVATAADTTALERWVGFKPSTSVEDGVNSFARWFFKFYN